MMNSQINVRGQNVRASHQPAKRRAIGAPAGAHGAH